MLYYILFVMFLKITDALTNAEILVNVDDIVRIYCPSAAAPRVLIRNAELVDGVAGWRNRDVTVKESFSSLKKALSGQTLHP